MFILTNGLVFGGPISAKTVLILLTLSKQNCNAKISVTNLSFPKNASYCHDVRHCLDTPKHHEKLPKILGFGPFWHLIFANTRITIRFRLFTSLNAFFLIKHFFEVSPQFRLFYCSNFLMGNFPFNSHC